MSNNEPDYNNNLAFAPGDWSDSRVVGNTDRTVSTIQLIEKIEELEKENKQLEKKLEIAIEALEDYATFCRHPAEDALAIIKVLDK